MLNDRILIWHNTNYAWIQIFTLIGYKISPTLRRHCIENRIEKKTFQVNKLVCYKSKFWCNYNKCLTSNKNSFLRVLLLCTCEIFMTEIQILRIRCPLLFDSQYLWLKGIWMSWCYFRDVKLFHSPRSNFTFPKHKAESFWTFC